MEQKIIRQLQQTYNLTDVETKLYLVMLYRFWHPRYYEDERGIQICISLGELSMLTNSRICTTTIGNLVKAGLIEKLGTTLCARSHKETSLYYVKDVLTDNHL